MAIFEARFQEECFGIGELRRLMGEVDSELSTYYDELEKLRLVSRRWNSVITSSPTIWSETYGLHAPEVVENALHFSKKAPIHVRCVLDPSMQEEVLEKYSQLVLPHSARWSTLELCTKRGSTGPESYLAAPAPSLESLSLAHNGPLDATLDLFAGTSPQLRRLTLKGCALP